MNRRGKSFDLFLAIPQRTTHFFKLQLVKLMMGSANVPGRQRAEARGFYLQPHFVLVSLCLIIQSSIRLALKQGRIVNSSFYQVLPIVKSLTFITHPVTKQLVQATKCSISAQRNDLRFNMLCNGPLLKSLSHTVNYTKRNHIQSYCNLVYSCT